MLRIKTEPREHQFIEKLVCDRCSKEIDPTDHIEWQESYSIRFTGGYGSVFGDGADVNCDLCQYCLKALIGGICYEVAS